MRWIHLAVLGTALFLSAPFSHGQSPATQPDALKPAGLAEIIRLWPGEAPATGPTDAGEKINRRGGTTNPAYFVSNVKQASMAVFPPLTGNGDAKAGPTAAVVICPGGGYAGESATSEGFAVAQKLAERGVAAFVLKYRLPDGRAPAAGELPLPQQDVLRAIQLVRSGAGRWNVDPNRVGVMGFSAGGHLAATAATLYDDAGTFAEKAGRDAASQVSARPDFAVLAYPVITMAKAGTHGGSRRNLIGEDADPAVEARFSADARVTPKTPPLFVFHAEDDKTVPVSNARLMAAAAAKAGVPCELLIMTRGGHGFGLGRPDAESGTWFPRLLDWMRARSLLN